MAPVPALRLARFAAAAALCMATRGGVTATTWSAGHRSTSCEWNVKSLLPGGGNGLQLEQCQRLCEQIPACAFINHADPPGALAVHG